MEILYTDYMSSEESEYEDQEDAITGEKERKLVGYAKRKFPWERTSLTSIKAKLDKAHCTKDIMEIVLQENVDCERH